MMVNQNTINLIFARFATFRYERTINNKNIKFYETFLRFQHFESDIPSVQLKMLQKSNQNTCINMIR